MIDLKRLRNEVNEIKSLLEKRGFDFDVEQYQALEAKRKSLQVKTQELQNLRNSISKEIGQAKAKGGSVESLMQKMKDIRDELSQNEKALENLQLRIEEIVLQMPNLPHASVPMGRDETANQLVRMWGKIPQFTFTPKQHFEITGSIEKQLDFNLGSKLSGSRFVVLKNKIAKLHRALAQFMLDLHIEEHGYEEVYVPYLLKAEAMYGTGQFPKFKEDQFGIENSDLWLLPTAEVPVTNLVRDEILDEDELPLKFVSHTTCFRKEAGSYGKDTRGMIRQHQFEKVELVQIVKPENSYQALEELTVHAEKVLQKLELPYRVMMLCTGDLGHAAAKTYDLEVWLPGQGQYREISSCSNTEDYQARRMQARFKPKGQKQTAFVHTLNGSGIAVGRTLVAIIENYQDEKGNIHIPKSLQPYMHGETMIINEN